MVLEASDQPGILAAELHADGSYAGILCVPGNVSGGKVVDRLCCKWTVRPCSSWRWACWIRLRAALAKANMQESDIDWLIPHQANLRIMMSTARKLKLSPEKVVITVDQHGNTSAASIPLALDHAVRAGQVKPGQNVMLEGVRRGMRVNDERD